jgi:hypothetical protein
MCLLAALLFFVNPIVGLGVYACAGVACWQRLSAWRIGTTIALAVATLAIFIVPWTLRNEFVLGSPVLLRSNLGLELALANYPGALDDKIEPHERMVRRLKEIHPNKSEAAYQAMRAAGGEVAYFQQLRQVTFQWMRTNPGATLWLALRHLRQTFLPQMWEFTVVNRSLTSYLRFVLANLVGGLGLIAIGHALINRKPRWIYVALLVLAPALCLSLFQPVVRYTYIFYPLLVFGAADLLTRAERPTRQIADQTTKTGAAATSSPGTGLRKPAFSRFGS